MAQGRIRKSQTSFHFIKILKLFFFLLAGIGFLLIFRQVITNNHYFVIQNVKIVGVKQTDPKLIKEVLIPLVHKNYFSADIQGIKEKLLQIPWVLDAKVKRVWPSEIHITVFEHTPIAIWNKEALLSANGEIFTPANMPLPNNLPIFMGPSGKQMEMMAYYQLMNKMVKIKNLKITQLWLTSDASWNMIFGNGIKINLGNKDILTRLDHFVKVYTKIIGERTLNVQYVDLRYPHGLAVRLKSIT